MQRRFPASSTRTRIARAGLLVCALALASIALACGKEESSAPTSAAAPAPQAAAAPAETPQAAPAAGGDAEVVPGEDGGPDTVMTEGVLPQGYPSDVPVYPGATIGSSMSTPGLGVFATFNSDDAPQTVLSHYRTELAKGGWSVVDTPDGNGVDGTKGNRTVQVRARKAGGDDNRTEIAVDASQG